MKRLWCCGVWVGLVSFTALAGCGGAQPAPSKPEGAAVARPVLPTEASCGRRHPGRGAVRQSALRQGGSVVLAKSGAATIAYVADEDTRALHTVDVATETQLATTKLAGAPAQALVLADGRVAVTLRDKNEIEVLEPGADPSAPLVSLCRRAVPAEPFGLAATADDARLLVTSAWAAKLTALDAFTMKPAFAVDLPREPRGVLLDDSGERAFVSHAVGAKLSVVDLGRREVRGIDLRVKKATPFGVRTGDDKLRGGAQGFALAKSVVEDDGAGEKPLVMGKAPRTPAPAMPKGRVFVPMVTVDPGDPNVRSQAYYGDSRDGVPKEAPIVSVVDADAERSMTRAVMSLGTPMAQECILPRAAATRASTGTLFVTCLGIDALLELDTRGTDPIRLERRRWSVPAGPMGVAIDDAGGKAVVWSQFDGKLSIVDLSPGQRDSVRVVSVSYEPAPDVVAIAKGRELFHTTDDLRIANDGIACASCHPDGREDAFTWSTPEGPRQTIMLAGRATNTAPYGWQGKHGDLEKYLGNTFSRLGGTGVQGPELAALITYLEKMQGPPQTVDAPPSEIERGRELFFDETLGCAGCHVGGPGVDKVTHDVGSRAPADNGATFDTPSLRFVRGTAPYFHDGRYSTLEDVLAATDTSMGHTGHLTVRERAALKAYLESL